MTDFTAIGDDEARGLDETRRCVYMLVMDDEGNATGELRATVANALLHHHPDRLTADQYETIHTWTLGGDLPSKAFWLEIVNAITAALP